MHGMFVTAEDRRVRKTRLDYLSRMARPQRDNCAVCGTELNPAQRWKHAQTCSKDCRIIAGTCFDWTAEKVTQLRNLVARGKTKLQIAEIMETTRNAISGKMDRLGLKSLNTPSMNLRKHDGHFRKAPSKPVAQLAAPEPPKGSKTFLETAHDECRYPYGDPKTSEFRMCGHKTFRKSNGAWSPWCQYHHQVVFPTR